MQVHFENYKYEKVKHNINSLQQSKPTTSCWNNTMSFKAEKRELCRYGKQ